MKRGTGFTLIELLVVFSIITVLTGVVFSSQSSFNKTLVLTNTAYDIALTLRSAETYGLSSRAAGAAASVGYGIHLSSGVRNSFILFADTSGGISCAGMTPDCKSGDHVYSAGGDAPPVQTYVIGNGITISNFCVRTSAGSSCVPDVSSLDIVFVRPNPNPLISANGSYSAANTGACLTIASPQGGTRSISIAASGQIIANATSCP